MTKGLETDEHKHEERWSKCAACPLTGEGKCEAHQTIVALNEVAHATLDRAERVGTWKIVGTGMVVISMLIGLYGLISSVGKAADANFLLNRSLLLQVVERQTGVLADVGMLKVQTLDVRDRMNRVEVQMSEHRKVEE